ncbi:MAG: glycoside hydrolase family 3 C-terminal domain-containing protein, partial [Bacteroidota bacterium]
SDILNKPYYWDLGEQTQQKAMTLLKNEDDILPLGKSKLKVYIENMDATVVQEYVEVVSSVSEANLAIVRLHTPWYPAESPNPYVKGFHHGDLNFKGKEKERLIKLLDRVPTVVDIYLDRPAVIPEIASKAKALIANYGASDRSVCEVLFGVARPLGKLPFELPSSMTAVEDQLTDVPYDSKDPLFEFGFGLSYSR